MRRLLPAAAAFVIALSGSAFLAGCGSDDDSTTATSATTTPGGGSGPRLDAARVLRATAAKRTAAVDLTVRATGFGLPGPIVVRGSGATALDATRMRLEVDPAPLLRSMGLPQDATGPVDLLLDGGRFDVHLSPDIPFPLPLPGGANAIRVDLAAALGQLDVDTAALGPLFRLDPGGLVPFAELYGTFRETGEGKVGDATTTRYTGKVSAQDHIDVLPRAQREAVTRAYRQLDTVLDDDSLDEKADVAVEVDEDGIIRRLVSSQNLPAEEGTPPGRLEITFDFSDFGAEIDTKPPPDGATFDATDALVDLLRQGALAGRPTTES
jgi:hypothetical protein